MKKESIPGRGAVYAASRLFVDGGTALSPGALAVSRGVVVAAGSPGEVRRTVPAGFRKVDLPGAAIMPGFVNAHAHLQIPRLGDDSGLARSPASSTASAPSAPPSFVDWIFRVIAWRLGAPAEEFRKNLEAAAREALAGGTTCVGEIAGPDVGVYASLPLRARVFAEGIGFLPADADKVSASVAAALDKLLSFATSFGTISAGVSPHTLYTVGPDLLGRLGELASRHALPACLHLAESPAEMDFLRTGEGDIATRLYPAVGKDVSWFTGIGMSIPSYLAGAGLLQEGLILVHNVHLSKDEIGALRAAGARFVLCPRSNAAHGNGSPDVTHFVDAGIPFALGTDSLGSVPTLSLWEEIRAARALYRGNLSEAALCRAFFRAATENGSEALGLPGGALHPNAPADFVAVDDPGGEGDAAFRSLIGKGEASSVRLTVVAGRPLHERT
ncbi:MAG: amidohydrolase family protein [Deltaproteobacteria bacterium]|nr:amidohydrolase family protein [Deltaproteobacteria bacterium]